MVDTKASFFDTITGLVEGASNAELSRRDEDEGHAAVTVDLGLAKAVISIFYDELTPDPNDDVVGVRFNVAVFGQTIARSSWETDKEWLVDFLGAILD